MRAAFATVVAIAAIAVSSGFGGPAFAQDDPPPCGPASHLPAELAGNVAADSRCFEIRMYTAEPEMDGKGGIDNLHRRFREGEVELFEKHGAEIVATWQSLDDPDTLIWMLAYRDRAHREQVFADFRADPAWHTLRAQYEVPLDAEVFMMSAADYSALR